MSIQANFPNLKPSLLLDFANTKQLDSRITFTRSTPAVYYDGKTTAMAEQNLLTYSQAFDNADWSKVTATITANSIAAPDGTTTADTLTSTTTGLNAVYRLFSTVLTIGSATASIYAKAGTKSVIQFGANAALTGSVDARANFDISAGTIGTVDSVLTASIVSVGSGWYRCVVSWNRTGSSSANGVWSMQDSTTAAREASSTSGNLYLWGAQLEQRASATAYTVTTTQAITNYIPVLLSAGGNQARFDCNPTTGESLGLLIEEARTNIALSSSDYANTGVWVASNSSVISNSNVAPDGTLTADTVIPNTSNVSHDVYQAIATANAITYTYSVYVKANGYTLFNIRTYPSGINVVYNLTNQTIDSSSGTNSGTSITSIGNSWYRLTLTFVTSSTTTYISTQPTASGYTVNTGNTIFAGNGFSGAFVWGAQLEVGTFASSYIATTSASVTRTTDYAVMTGTNFTSWYSNNIGTIYASASVPSSLNVFIAGSSTFFTMGSGRVTSLINSTGYAGAFLDQVGGFVFTSNVVNLNAENRTATSFSQGNYSICLNNGTVVSYSSTSIVQPSVQFVIGKDSYNNSINIPIRKIAYYPSVLTNAQLQALTS